MNRTPFMTVPLCALALACGEGRRELPSGFEYPVGLEDALLYIAPASGDADPRAMLVDISRSEPRVREIGLAPGAVRSVMRPGQAAPELIVLTSGQSAELEDGKVREAVDAHVSVFDGDGEQARYALAHRFGELAVSDDGRYAIAYAPPSGAFEFETNVELVDLSKKPDDAAATRSIALTYRASDTPVPLAFSPANARHRFALLKVTNEVVLVNLDDAKAGQIAAQLVLPTSGQRIDPEEVLFAGERIYVRGEGSPYVLALELLEDGSQRSGFRVTPFQISAASQIADMALTGEDEDQRLVVLSANELTVFDALGLETASIETNGNFDAELIFEGRSPVDDEVRSRVLLYGANESRLGFVDVALSNVLVGQELELLDLGERVRRLLPLVDEHLVVAVHESGRLSVVDLERRTVAPISLGASAHALMLDDERARLWVASGSGEVGSIDLRSLQGSEILLEPQTESLLLVPGKKPRVAFVHPSDSGHVTLLDAARPARSSARELVGFLWSDLFD